MIIFSSLIDFIVGIKLSKAESKRKRKLLLLTSISVNLGFLGFFKYFNFFADSFANAFTLFGTSFDPARLSIILPVGISFYTFQTLSYSIDVYRRKLEPNNDIIAFFAFVSFFPQLVAGPIERAANLLPQFRTKRNFDYSRAADGMRQILWGLFKKIVIADNCAIIVDDIFHNYSQYPGSTLLLGAVFFSLQIYSDFSGYSDIAIGTGRLFGFNLMRNFAFPYFSRDIAEFWRRWHISLSTWFRDYLYIPLGGSRGGVWLTIRNIFIIFTVTGFWHGANWTFIVWGLLHALYFLPLLLLSRNRKYMNDVAEGRFFPNIREILQIGTTFFQTTIAFVFFRAETIEQSLLYLGRMFSESLFSFPSVLSGQALISLTLIGLMVMIEWMKRDKQHGLQFDSAKSSKVFRWSSYVFIILLILLFGKFDETEFIYFQF